MKKLIAPIIAFLFFIISCSGISIDPNAQDVLLKITSIKLGASLAKKYPEDIQTMIDFATEFKEQSSITPTVLVVIKDYLESRIEDPVDAACYQELLSMVQVEGTDLFNTEKVVVAIDGFLIGVQACQLSTPKGEGLNSDV